MKRYAALANFENKGPQFIFPGLRQPPALLYSLALPVDNGSRKGKLPCRLLHPFRRLKLCGVTF